MRQILIFITAIFVLAGIFIFAGSPITDAQGDSTPTPGQLQSTPQPGSAPTQTSNVQLVVSLPFSDTFEGKEYWLAQGWWQIDETNSYEGTGWALAATFREVVSTLTYRNLIDLSGALSAQLVYRQKGILPESDLIAVDISLDGGRTWFSIDQQIGIDTDWTLYIVDLTKYRGQVIQLRFRANVGAPYTYEEESVPGYWIDNLAIQYVLNEPEFAFNLEYTKPRTLMGLHMVVGARKEPVIDLAKRLKAIGWPLGTLKGTSSTEDILNEVAAISPDTIIVYRSLLTPGGMIDCPNTANDPIAEATAWMNGVRPYWDKVNADYYELVNECEPPADWLIAFTIESMRLASARGECLLVFSFPVGNPEPYEFAQLMPVYDYALKNPCQPGRYHGVALHTYGVNPATLVSESGVYLGYRHRLFYNLMIPELPEVVHIPVYLTEAGTGDGIQKVNCTDVTRDIIQYTRQLEFDPYIRGFHFWNLGPGAAWVDYTDCLPMIGDALINYYAQK